MQTHTHTLMLTKAAATETGVIICASVCSISTHMSIISVAGRNRRLWSKLMMRAIRRKKIKQVFYKSIILVFQIVRQHMHYLNKKNVR